jgi:hypothetical protein
MRHAFRSSCESIAAPARSRIRIAVLCACLALVGCDDRPKAPELRNTPVYHNKQAGFRFLVPDGWNQTTNAALPAGPIPGEVWVVRYMLQTPERGATLQLLAYEESLHPNAEAFHSEASFGVERWKPAGPSESIDADGVRGSRLIYGGSLQAREFTKEVAAFVRDGRVYCFVAMFQSRDDQAREQVRRAIGSLKWDR